MSDEQMNYRIGEIFRLVTNLVEQGKEHGKKLETLDQKVETVDQKVTVLDKKVDIMSGQLSDVTAKVISHEKRLSTTEKDVADLRSGVH